jgi:hypothetical protein
MGQGRDAKQPHTMLRVRPGRRSTPHPPAQNLGRGRPRSILRSAHHHPQKNATGQRTYPGFTNRGQRVN